MFHCCPLVSPSPFYNLLLLFLFLDLLKLSTCAFSSHKSLPRVLRTHDSYFRLSPLRLFLQQSVVQRCPSRYEPQPQVESDDVPAEGAVVEESTIEHNMARPGETVRQLV